MGKIESVELLRIPKAVKEIHRHLWFESEKAGCDLGFEWAAEDWLKKYAKAWMDYHMPAKKKSTSKKSADKVSSKPKKRRIKSYIDY